MTTSLPDAVAAYFAAANRSDAGAVAACFTDVGRVHDEGHSIQGRDAIRTWAEETQRKYRFQAEVLDAERQDGNLVIAARVSGQFPGSPAVLTYRFSLADERIDGLEIG